jgi:hypothetical protein
MSIDARVSEYTETPSWVTYLDKSKEGEPIPTTISAFMMKVGIIDCDPIGQRLDVGSLEKKQGIIVAILTGQDICEIALRHMDRSKSDVTHEYRSIDGGHRKRAIKEFSNNKFKLGNNVKIFCNGKVIDCSNKTYGQLDAEVQQQFDSYKLRFVVYGKEMTDAQAGETFRLRNLSTDVNHQETLNSYEDNLVAQLVRETARNIPQLDNEPHKLFTITTNTKGELKPEYWKDAPKRLIHDEYVARILTAILKTDSKGYSVGVTTNSDKEVKKMYLEYGDPVYGLWVKNPAEMVRAKKKLDKALDFILEYAKQRKKSSSGVGMIGKEAVMVSRLYMYLEKEYQSTWKLEDPKLFYKEVKKTLNVFCNDKSKDKKTAPVTTGKHLTNSSKKVQNFYDDGKSYAVAMKGHLAVYDVQWKIENTVLWFLEELKVPLTEIGIVVRDPKRSLTTEEHNAIWMEQNQVCFIDGEPLDFEDAQGGHVKPWAEGGKTVPENIRMIRKIHNTQMGTMSMLDYKKFYLKNKNVSY